MQATSQESDSQETGTIADVESQFLFINMLEFLGEFETEDGEWINPEILGDDVFADLDNDTIDNETGRNTNSEQRALSLPANED